MKGLNKTHRIWFAIGMVFLLIVLAAAYKGIKHGASEEGAGQQKEAEVIKEKDAGEDLSNEGYKLEQVLVLSRHNIRSPLSGGDSVLGKVTPHEWFHWSSPASQLSVRGGVLESCMGQYFRKWLEKEGLFPENYQPREEAVRIYANSKQRTIATARFFAAGLLPTMNEDVEYHADFDTMDPVFHPKLTFVSEKYKDAALKQIGEMYSDEIESLSDNYTLLTDVIDLKDSDAWKDKSIEEFKTDDWKVDLETGEEPALEGSLKTAGSVSDALVLQYYEEEDPKKAAFGESLDGKQWKDIAEIVGVYGQVLFGSPLISCNVANPLLKEMQSEMSADGRQFTFLCGHDSNIMSVLSALGAEDYKLPEAIEYKTPIGCKLVFSKWRKENGEVFWDVDLVYQTTEQLRSVDILTEEDHPAVVDIDLAGVEQNGDGLYPDKEIKERFTKAINEYDRIADTY